MAADRKSDLADDRMSCPQGVPRPAPVRDVKSAKSHFIYILLAFFLGGLGTHNFYIDRMQRGSAQFTISILSIGVFLPVSIFWAGIDLFSVREDGGGRPFHPSCRILAAIAGVALLLFGLAIPVSALLPALSHTRDAARSTKCFRNLTRLAVSMSMYADDNSDYLPTSADGDWQRLLGPYAEDSDSFSCAGRGAYIYLGNDVNLSDIADSHTVPIFMDRLDNLHWKKVCILFADGHVDRCEPGAGYADTVRRLSGGGAPESVMKNAEILDRNRRSNPIKER